MRGAVSLAAALAIPMTVSGGDAFPQRDLILFLTFSAILATLVLQGLTLGPLIGALRLKSEDEGDKVEELETRLEGARAAIERLEQLDGERIPSSAQERTREQYEERIRRYEAGIEAGGTTEEYAQSSAALARLAARAHQGRAGGGTLHAGPRRGQPGGGVPRNA